MSEALMPMASCSHWSNLGMDWSMLPNTSVALASTVTREPRAVADCKGEGGRGRCVRLLALVQGTTQAWQHQAPSSAWQRNSGHAPASAPVRRR